MTWSTVHAHALNSVFKALNESETPWLLLRNHHGLPWRNSSKDIDIGVEQGRLHEAEIVVDRALRSHGFDRKQTTVFQWGLCTSYFGVIDGRAASIKIDLMDGFSWRAAGLFNAARLISRAVPHNGFLIPNPIDDATIMWLKPLMTGGFVKQAYVPDIAEAVSVNPAGFRSNLERLFRDDLADLAWQHLERGDYKGLTAYRRKLSWNAWTREVKTQPVRSIRNAFSYVFWEVLRRSWRPRGVFLAVVGPDGVGKTTFITALRERLAILQVKDPEAIDVLHFRPHLLPNINELLTGKPEIVGDFNNPHSAPPAGTLSSFLRVAYYSLDYIFGYWLRLRRLMVAGQTIIFDRYVYEFIVDPRRSRLSLPAWGSMLFLPFIPKPDLVFVLEAPAADIYGRKQELPLEEIERQLASYRRMVDSEPSRFHRIDARQSPDVMVDVAVRELVTRLYREV